MNPATSDMNERRVVTYWILAAFEKMYIQIQV